MGTTMSNRQVAAILYEVADLLEMKDVKFKPVAYRRAAHGIETLAEDIGRVAERGELEDLPGVGTHIATKIREILDSGKLGYLERLNAEVGPGVREPADVGGIGPKKAMLLHQKLGIRNLADLEAAARAGKIRELAGFGEKSEQNILAGIAARKATAGRYLLGRMLPAAEQILARLAVLPAIRKISLGGSLRRMKETIGDIDILASSPDPEAVMAVFTTLPEVTRVLGRGPTKSSIVLESGVQVDLRVVGEGQYLDSPPVFHRLKGPQYRSPETCPRTGLEPFRVRAEGGSDTEVPCRFFRRGPVPDARPAVHRARAPGEPGGDRGRRERFASRDCAVQCAAGRPPYPFGLE